MRTTIALLLLSGLDLAVAVALAPDQVNWIILVALALICPISACALALTDSAEVAARLADLTKERLGSQRKA